MLTNDTLREQIFVESLGGLRVFILPKKGFRRKYAEIFVRYGSNDNAFVPPGKAEPIRVPAGIAHFMEHKMFEKEWGEAFSRFAELGTSANAYTTNNYTSYLFWALENFEESLKLLMEVAFVPYFSEQSVKKEQGIIGQEIRMYDDDPGSRLMRETMEALYSEHPVRLDVAGTVESIAEIDAELLYLCHSSFYRPSNMSLYLAGDFAKDDVMRAVTDALEHVAQLKEAAKPSSQTGDGVERLRPKESMEVGDNREVSLPVPTPLVQVAWKLPLTKTGGLAMLAEEMATSILLNILFGKSSRFFMDAYEDGLVDDLGSSHEAWPDYAYATVVAQSVSPEKFSDRVWAEIELAQKHSGQMDLEKDFIRSKKAATGRYVTLFDSLDSVGGMHARLSDIGLDVFSYGRLLEDLSFDLVLESLRNFTRDRSVRVIVRDSSNRK